MKNKNRIPFGMKFFGFCAALSLGAGTAMAQTPSGAIFTYQYNQSDSHIQYIDFDVTASLEGDKFEAWNWPTSPSRHTLFQHLYYENTPPAPGVCMDIQVFQQSGTPAPDWSLWAEKAPTLRKISDNYNGTVMPRMRLWVENSYIFVKLSAGIDAASTSSHGAAWLQNTRMYISKASCENAGLPTMSVVNNVVTFTRTGT
jgi:hypothetical protein